MDILSPETLRLLRIPEVHKAIQELLNTQQVEKIVRVGERDITLRRIEF